MATYKIYPYPWTPHGGEEVHIDRIEDRPETDPFLGKGTPKPIYPYERKLFSCRECGCELNWGWEEDWPLEGEAGVCPKHPGLGIQIETVHAPEPELLYSVITPATPQRFSEKKLFSELTELVDFVFKSARDSAKATAVSLLEKHLLLNQPEKVEGTDGVYKITKWLVNHDEAF